MKRSENGCVSDRPTIPMTCRDTRHRSSAAAVGGSSAQSDAVQTSSDTRAAPTPLPRPDALHYVIAIVVDVDTGVTNGFLTHWSSSSRSTTSLATLDSTTPSTAGTVWSAVATSSLYGSRAIRRNRVESGGCWRGGQTARDELRRLPDGGRG